MSMKPKQCQDCKNYHGNRDNDPRVMNDPKAPCDLKAGSRLRVGMVWCDATCGEWEAKING